jgi:phosphate transport system permease protein
MTPAPTADLRKLIARHRLWERVFTILGLVALLVGLLVLLSLFLQLAVTGAPRLTPEFFTSFPSRIAERAGILSAWVGSLLVMLVTACTAIPMGVAAGVYLEEYAPKNWLTAIIEINVMNLAGVPSIIYGLLALGLFVYQFGFGQSILSAGLTLALLILPLLIINAQEAIRAVPNSLRQASYGLGATKWQTIWHHVLPNALPGILTGTILAISRAVGETAPLVVVGVSTYIVTDPSGPFSKFTTLPAQIYQWTSRPQDEFRNLAAAAIIVLLAMLLSLNAAAILLRNRYSKRW